MKKLLLIALCAICGITNSLAKDKHNNYKFTRGLSSTPGCHSPDYQEAFQRAVAYPLTDAMKEMLRTKIGSIGLKKLLPLIKLYISENNLLPTLKRIETHQEYALHAYISAHWNLLQPYFETALPVDDFITEFGPGLFPSINGLTGGENNSNVLNQFFSNTLGL
jgi:hypothetical protein